MLYKTTHDSAFVDKTHFALDLSSDPRLRLGAKSRISSFCFVSRANTNPATMNGASSFTPYKNSVTTRPMKRATGSVWPADLPL